MYTPNTYTFMRDLVRVSSQALKLSWFLCVFTLSFLSQCYSLTTHKSGDGRTVGGVSRSQSDKNWQLIPLPLPLLYLSPPSSCLIMLLCVCLSVCFLCVEECVFLRSLCQCVCSSNTGFSPHYPPPPPLFFSPHLQWLHTHLFPISNKTFVIYFSYFLLLYFPHSTCPITHKQLSTCPFVDASIPSSIHSSIHPPIHPTISFGFPLLTSFIKPLPLFLSFSSLASCSPFSLPPSPFPLRLLLPSSLPLSLSHTVLCASLSLAGLLLGGWEFVCTQVPAEHPLHPGSQPGSASLLLFLLLLLSLPSPSSLAISSPFTFLRPLHTTPHTTFVRTAPTHPLTLLPPHLLLSFLPCWKHTALRFFSGVSSNYPSLRKNLNPMSCNYIVTMSNHSYIIIRPHNSQKDQ